MRKKEGGGKVALRLPGAERKGRHERAFTLIELLVVIAIIAILAAVVIIAVNPARQLAQANNAQRRSDVNTILNAIGQYMADNRGAVPAAITTTLTEICRSDGTPVCTGLINLTADLKPTYVVELPRDPTCANANGTCYRVAKDANNRITVDAPNAELGQTISVKR